MAYIEIEGAAPTSSSTSTQGLVFDRYFTTDTHPFDEVEWEIRTASISGESGTVFEQTGVEVPKSWSQLATNIVASKYFRGQLGTREREYSVKQLIARVVNTIVRWGKEGGYFASDKDARVFGDEITYLILHQMMAWNSPVWFNIGVPHTPQQSSACFLLSVEDNMESILNWYTEEGKIFLGGSGSGVNLSKIRSKNEPLSGGGVASGPLSFARAADASSGAIKSGGKTRRSAKLICLNVSHPDIEDFIWCKVKEEHKARILIEAGYSEAIDGDAYGTVSFQNANNSVQITDQFMHAVENDAEWDLRYVTNDKIFRTLPARALMRQIAEAAWQCGDPGVQFYDTINRWHTLPSVHPINTSNPCGEYLSIPDSACNLASLNLLKFLNEDNSFNTTAFKKAVDFTILSQEILVSQSDFPTEKIANNAWAYRQLGLGYANLGALLMSMGHPYDSDAGRGVAAGITALMTGEAYAQSARIAAAVGPFPGYGKNKESMLDVIVQHHNAAHEISTTDDNCDLVSSAQGVWKEALHLGQRYGYRNSQATVLAPTGTISFMLDCDTTGIEPAIALVAHKKLVGGGTLQIVNHCVERALHTLGYTPSHIKPTLAYIQKHGNMENSVWVQTQHLPVFDCALPSGESARTISWQGHINMMAAVQPFLSGAISKTINMSSSATIEDIMNVYMEAWKLGLKSVAIYRDGCKRSQPLNTKKAAIIAAPPETPGANQPTRRRLPSERKSLCHKFAIAGHEGYIHAGMYENGELGEVFVRMAKEGSTVSGLMDTIATLTSLSLQYGVPLSTMVEKFSHVRYEPSGFTGNGDIPYAKSLTDYLFRFLGQRFLGQVEAEKQPVSVAPSPTPIRVKINDQSDSPVCTGCGSLMVRRSGSCFVCDVCGSTSGGCS